MFHRETLRNDAGFTPRRCNITDDADRENEGDCICAARFATRENVNFMASYAKGLICMPMSVAPMSMPADACAPRSSTTTG